MTEFAPIIDFDAGEKSSGLSLRSNTQEAPSRKRTFAENHHGATNIWAAAAIVKEYANATDYGAYNK